MARRGGWGEDEGTDRILNCAVFWRDLGCSKGGHGGAKAFVGGSIACIVWLVRRWESLAVADLEIVRKFGGRIYLWLRSWKSLVVAELVIIGDGGAGNNALWRSWGLLAWAELGFLSGG